MERKQDGATVCVAEGSGPLQKLIGGDLEGGSHLVCWVVLSTTEGLQPHSRTSVYADKMQSMRLSPGTAWQESFFMGRMPSVWLTR